MTQYQSREEILNLVATHQLSADEAAEMLEALMNEDEQSLKEKEASLAQEQAVGAKIPMEEEPVTKQSAGEVAKSPTALRVRVTNSRSGRGKVNVKIPFGFVKAGLKLASGFVPEMRSVEWGTWNELLENPRAGTLIEVDDDEDGSKVELFLE